VKKDLSGEVTAFIVSCEKNPNFENCVKALRSQTVKVKINVIKNYHPMSLAFQQMLERCDTPYYIEVDEDMILNEDAVEIMYEKIKNSEENFAMFAYLLKDVHLDFDLYGVKIYKYDIFKKYPYNLECLSCEVEQLDRIKKDNYKYDCISELVGEHSPLWTCPDIFERYYNLMEKFKVYGYTWLEDLPLKLLNILRKNPTDENVYAFLGAYTSIIKKGISEEEKDFTQSKRLEYGIMEGFLNRPHSATIYMTSKCNFNCGWCYRQHNDIENAPDMSIKILDDFLLKFPTIKAACICGFGEPFLSPDLKYIIEFLRKKDIYIGLITNGSLLEDKLLELYENEIFLPHYISISLNASNREDYEKLTGFKDFNKVIRGIKLCLKQGMETYVSYVCTKKSIENIPDFLKLMKSIGIETVHLHNLLPHFKEEENSDFWDLVLQKKDKDLITRIRELPEADIVKRYPILISQDETRRNCKFPWSSIAINGNGNISVCNSVYPCDAKNGNINDLTLWQGKYCQNFRKSLLSKQYHACEKCFRNWEE